MNAYIKGAFGKLKAALLKIGLARINIGLHEFSAGIPAVADKNKLLLEGVHCYLVLLVACGVDVGHIV